MFCSCRIQKILSLLIIAVVFPGFIFVMPSSGFELSGYIAGEGRLFFNDPIFPGQRRDSASFVFQPEFYHRWNDGSSLIFTPFARIDSADSKRTHLDIRELNYSWLHDYWVLRVGIGKVFWGVTEFVHLVDIINQTDLVEYIDGEDKLGQPMIYFSIPGDWGVVDMFVLPYFRKRTFPGEKGRFRTGVTVDSDETVFESSAEEYNIDFALRYTHTINRWDFGIYHFKGTGREPTLLSGMDSSGIPVLIPFYEQIDQTGLDVLVVEGNWLLKLESLYRIGQGDDFFAAVGGLEYSFMNIAASGIDLGLIGEWAYDERGQNSPTGFDNDLMIGARLALNDIASTETLVGFIHDMDSDDRIFTLESSRRLNNHWKISMDAFFVVESSRKDIIHSLRDDDSVQVQLMYYF